MIIKYIENKSGFWFFSKPKLVIYTDEGEGGVEGNIDEKAVRELNEKIKDFVIGSREDFLKLKEICGENYKTVENALVNASKKLWFSLNEEANVIPRPAALLLKKNSGIKEFYCLSLDCRDFQQGCFVNRKIYEHLISKLSSLDINADEAGFYHDLDDKKVLDILSEAIKDANKTTTFTTRIVVNLKNGKGDNKQIDFNSVVNFVFNDNALIVMNPFIFSNLFEYEKLKEKIVGDCFIGVENLNDFDDKKADFFLLKQQDIPQILDLSKKAKGKKLNIFFDGDADLCVGFGFPIIKIDLKSKGADNKIARVNQIFEEIKEYREGLNKENSNNKTNIS